MTRPSKCLYLRETWQCCLLWDFPLPLCIQLQLSCLRIDEAMWTARSSPGGFSVNLFWPAPVPEKNDVQHKKRRKRRRRRTKARSQVTISNTNPDVPATNLPVCDQSKSILPHESCMRAQKPAENPAVDLTACNDVNYEVREGVHGVTYHDKTGDQPNWTPVVAKRKKKQVPVSIAKGLRLITPSIKGMLLLTLTVILDLMLT